MDIGYGFSILNRRFQAIVAAACEDMDLSFSEYVVLTRIFNAEGKSQDELATMLFMDKAIVTRALSLLEKKGMIRREKDKIDKRVKHIYPTELAKGRRTYLTGIVDAWIGMLLTNFNDNERNLLLKGIRRATSTAGQINTRDFVERLHDETAATKV